MSRAALTTTQTELPDELWCKILLLSNLSFNELIQLTTVSHQFHRLILNEWFLKKYLDRYYPKLTDGLVIHLNFATVGTQQYRSNPFVNSIPATFGGALGISDVRKPPCGVVIRPHALFNHILKLKNNHQLVTNSFILDDNEYETLSFSFWFFLRSSKSIEKYVEQNLIDIAFDPTLTPTSSYPNLHVSIDQKIQINVSTNCKEKILEASIDQEPLKIKTWHNLAIVFRNTERYTTSVLYLNGQKFRKSQFSTSLLQASRVVLIRSNLENGNLADIAFWTRELLPVDIKAIYQQKTTVEKIDIVQGVLRSLNL